MNRSTRRTFLKRTLAAAATITIAGTKASGRVLGANDAIRIGVAGLNGRGKDHVVGFAGLPDVQITHLIDPDRRVFAGGIKDKKDNTTKSVVDYVRDKCGTAPKTVQDVRHALADRNLDAITIATPNHWHALMTIWACDAGKDVYVEKPCCHNLVEGHMAAAYARRHERMVQHGTQNRSNANWAKVAAIIQSGKLGKLLVSRGLCYKTRGPIGTKSPEAAPADLDFNLWLGPAADRPFHRNLVHYNWHWFWDFGNGDIGNQGVHQMDIARWMIPKARYPRSVISLGGRFGYTDQGETPNTQIAIFDYGPTKLIFEVRGLPTDGYEGEKVGNTLHLEEGTILSNDGGKIRFIPKGKTTPEPLPDFGVEIDMKRYQGGHYANFISAVRSRRVDDLTAEVYEGFYSSALCLLANASYRVGEMVPFNQKTKAFGDDKDAYEAFARTEEHLAKNKVPLDGHTYRLGRKLKYNSDLDNVSDPEARQHLSGKYRKGFELPGKVL
jgi:predicted dehydrogenase